MRTGTRVPQHRRQWFRGVELRVLVLVLLAAGAGPSAPRMLAVSLGTAWTRRPPAVARSLDEAARTAGRPGRAVGARERVAPEAGKTPVELRRQQEAETQFTARATRPRASSPRHSRISSARPGEERRGLAIEVRLLQAQVLRAMGRFTEADESFRHVPARPIGWT